jgi:hypothetical protein
MSCLALNGFNIQNDIQALTIILKLIKTAPNGVARAQAMCVAISLTERMPEDDVIKAIEDSDTEYFIRSL